MAGESFQVAARRADARLDETDKEVDIDIGAFDLPATKRPMSRSLRISRSSAI